jgi:hypothetical protein
MWVTFGFPFAARLFFVASAFERSASRSGGAAFAAPVSHAAQANADAQSQCDLHCPNQSAMCEVAAITVSRRAMMADARLFVVDVFEQGPHLFLLFTSLTS